MSEVGAAISGIDIAVLIAYFVVTIIIGVWVAKTTETGDDLFLAGRALTWGVIGFSLFASNISSTTLIGLAGAAYSAGISVSTYEWMSGVPLIILAFVFAPLYLRSRITTIPEFLELRFDRRSRVYFSLVTILLSIIVDTAGGLYAGSVVLKTFFPDLVIWQVCLGLGLFAGIYTAAGGLKAVVYTDVLQAVVLIFGSTLMTIIMFGELDYSWARVVEAAPAGHLSMIQPLDDPQLPWLGIIMGVSLLGFWYWVTNQYIVQRVLGAKDLKHAQWGAMLGGFLKLIPLFTMVLPGAMAIVLLPDLPNADMVFPTLVTTVLPVGITGLVLAGLVAAIMSSVDSTLNSASTLVVHDFIEPHHPEFKPEKVGRYGQVTTLILMVVAIAWAPMISNFGGLWSYLQQAFSILVPPIAAIFLIGVFWRRGNGDGAFWSLVVGHSVGLVVFFAGQFGYWPIHFTINVGIMALFSTVVFVVVSLATAAPDAEQIERTTWRPEIAIAEGTLGGAWYRNLKIQAGLLILAMLAVLIGFW
ncbi:sodium/solute symporter [Pelagibius litoralis]|uniref:Sodium/solute symporter n=1 Tax=Pelagibius litoralis TaxID=374515 RepID=A0A967F2Z2_9PROT|nr:sodium:solute symporter [Pelagibius litoralis]NIA72204.1 sodium/solute symporter [Pelagibius litoralis]